MSVCLKLNNSGTAGVIWLDSFFVSSVLPQDGFRPKKTPDPDPGSGFSKNPEKPIL